MFDGVEQRARQTGAGGAGGRTTYDAFLAADEAWSRLRNMKVGQAAGPRPEFVSTHATRLPPTVDAPLDVVVCGGTLGVFVAAALAQRGARVAVLERGPLRGRAQEWNISRNEMRELVELGLLTEAEVEAAIAIEFNPVRVGFSGSPEVWTSDVLNLGVRPDYLVQLMRRKLEAAGGQVLEGVELRGMEVRQDGVLLRLGGGGGDGNGGGGGGSLNCRLVVDCMGHASPVVRQVRWGRKPDGVCLVVGGCASGFSEAANKTADVIYTNGDLVRAGGGRGAPLQYFWEAFPAAPEGGDGGQHTQAGGSSSSRTTYLFTYCDAQAWRPSLADVFDDYWRLLPSYQQLPAGLNGLVFRRLMFGFFPTFRDSPLRPAFDRVIQVGDASGIQSPLSFGGFGALSRHLGRLSAALTEALQADALSRSDLASINAYNPGLSSAWMLQTAMTAARSADAAGDGEAGRLINRMLGGNFGAMQRLGEPVMRPFLQDVIQFGPLLQTMAAQVVDEPMFVPKLIAHVGPAALADWLLHVSALGTYSALHAGLAPLLRRTEPLLTPRERFRLHRQLDAWEYGCGADYQL